MKNLKLQPGGLVLLPDGGRELLRRELAYALEELGFKVRRVLPEALLKPESKDYLPRLLEAGPALFFSVNLQGLLPGGQTPALLRQAAVPVLAWFVDNPWHVLAAMRDPGWKEWNLAVTDESFLTPLRAAGAAWVRHLPLAACPRCLAEGLRGRPAPLEEGEGGDFGGALKSLVFAGRSVFPGLEGFFAGQTPPPELLAEAAAMCGRGEHPDFHWWLHKLDLTDQALWPGKKARRPGLGAVLSNKAWRGQRLAAARPGGLTLFGDAGWAEALGPGDGFDLRPPFDYYASAHDLYRRAEFSLNLNSLLLPAGLTQRGFDVWLAGGFCLTDNSPGLDIFPAELTKPVTFRKPEELPELVEKFRGNAKLKAELREAWRGRVLAEHTYARRLQGLLFD